MQRPCGRRSLTYSRNWKRQPSVELSRTKGRLGDEGGGEVGKVKNYKVLGYHQCWSLPSRVAYVPEVAVGNEDRHENKCMSWHDPTLIPLLFRTKGRTHQCHPPVCLQAVDRTWAG